MAAPRFFCPLPLQARHTFELPSDLAHYALRVLRLKSGTPIVLFDGSGGQFPAVLQTAGKKALAETGEREDIEVELAGDITLVQGIATGDKMDWIVEKAVELGVKRLVPIAAQRSVLQLSGERLLKRHNHWERVARSASEQCGRNRILRIEMPQSLKSCLEDRPDGEQVLFCHPQAPVALSQALPRQTRRLMLLVGPEGGWSPDEQEVALRLGALPVSFGPRVLRTETAGLALIAAVIALQGWS